jgi:hypothetical protein
MIGSRTMALGHKVQFACPVVALVIIHLFKQFRARSLLAWDSIGSSKKSTVQGKALRRAIFSFKLTEVQAQKKRYHRDNAFALVDKILFSKLVRIKVSTSVAIFDG